MEPEPSLTAARLRAPRAAATAGIVFSVLLLSSRYIEGILLVFPLWVLLISVYILVGNLGRPERTRS